MGKIKEYIAELAETFEDMLWHTETWGAAINQMNQILSPDEFEFFLDHIDMIKEIIHLDDESYPTNEARGLKGDVLRLWGRRARAKKVYGRGNRAGYDPEEDYIDADDEEGYPDEITTFGPYDTPVGEQPWTMKIKAGNPRDFNKKHGPDEFGNDPRDFNESYESYPTNEARGLKGDVLRPYGGRKARAKMGYGRGNRASYNPKDEIDHGDEILRQEALMQDVEDGQRGPMSSRIIGDEEVFDVEPKKIEWPEEMDDEMLSGHDHEGDPDMDYDLDYINDPDEDIYPTNESLLMPSINEYWDDEKEEQRQWDAAENRRRRFKEREQTAGEYSDEDERDFVRSQKGLYVKVGKMYMPALYHTPDIGRTDGKLYRKNNKTGGYFPVRG